MYAVVFEIFFTVLNCKYFSISFFSFYFKNLGIVFMSIFHYGPVRLNTIYIEESVLSYLRILKGVICR